MRPIYLAVFSVSAGLISFEISLLQMLSMTQWHHFASLIISVALLGFGAAGSAIAIKRDWMLRHFDYLLASLLAGCAVAIALAVPASQTDIARFDSYLVFVQARQVGSLALTCVVLATPFFLGAVAIGLTFVRFTEDVGRLYLWNLVGSGVGGIVALALMWITEPQTIAPISGLIAAAGAAVAASRLRSGIVGAGAIGASLICLYTVVSPVALTPSQFKDIERALDLPDAKIVYREADPHGVVEVVAAPAARQAPGLSLRFQGAVPVQDLVFVNGDAVGSVPHRKDADVMELMEYTTRALPYVLRVPDSVLVLEAGTGTAVRQAAHEGAHHVLAVDPRTALTSLWHASQPNVEIHNVEARTWLETDRAQYDLVVLPEMGRFGGTVGLEEMRENYLMTRQALRNAWDRLDPNGAVVLTAWLDYPYRAPLQALSSLIDAFESELARPRDHVVAIRSWADITFVVSRSPVTAHESDLIRAFCEDRGFDPLLLAGVRDEERGRYNQLADSSLFIYVDALLGSKRDSLLSNYPFLIAPVTDNRPYPMRFVRWKAIPEVMRAFGDRTVPFFGLGLFIAVLTLVQAILLSGILILAPLAALKGSRGNRLRTFIYFASLGLGYLLVEIVFIQRFTLFLGNAVYAATAVISAMLIGSGVGSYCSSRIDPTSSHLGKSTLIVSGAILLYAIALQPIFSATISADLPIRGVIALIAILPPAFLMGFPFPLGLRLLGDTSPKEVPWAWGINGFLSVVAAAGAGLLALEFGFTAVLLIAATMYAIAVIVSSRWS